MWRAAGKKNRFDRLDDEIDRRALLRRAGGGLAVVAAAEVLALAHPSSAAGASEETDSQLVEQYVKKGELILNVADFGAVGDGVADDTVAVRRAIDALSDTGGDVLLTGRYRMTAGLDLDTRNNVRLVGQASANAGAATCSTLVFSDIASGSLISARGGLGFALDGVHVIAPRGFTGRVIDLRGVTFDTQLAVIRNTYIDGGGTAAVLVDLDRSLNTLVENANLVRAIRGVRGVAAPGSYSNRNMVSNCHFISMEAIGSAIHNPGQAWTIQSCTFEQRADNTAGALTHDEAVTAEALVVTGCWTGDSVGGTQFTVTGKDIVFLGNWVGATGGTGLATDGITHGLFLAGNHFVGCQTAISVFTSGSNSGQVILANTFSGVTTQLMGTLSDGAITTLGDTATLYSPTLTGSSVTLVDGADLCLGAVTGTKVGIAPTQKLGFYGAIPIVRPRALTPPDSSVIDKTYDAKEANVIKNLRTRVNELESRLRSLGLLS